MKDLQKRRDQELNQNFLHKQYLNIHLLWQSPNGETLKIHGTPWKLSETPSKPGIAPNLGAHNKEILNSLGYDDQAIENLKEIKAI